MVRKQSFKSAPSKRRTIRKRVVDAGTMTVAAAQTAATLDTIEEEETLVRIVGNYDITNLTGADNIVSATLLIAVAPAGTDLVALADPSAGNIFEGRDAKNIIWHGKYGNSLDNSTLSYELETKAMRKLSEGDVIKLYARSSVANLSVDGMYTLFFKKA